MKVVTVNYQKVFPLGAYINEKIGVEIQLDDAENPEHAFKLGKELVEMWHRQSNPGLNIEVNYSAIPGHPSYSTPDRIDKSEEQISRDQQIQGYKEIINMATTPKQLEMHRGNIEKLSDEALTAAFETKLQSFQTP